MASLLETFNPIGAALGTTWLNTKTDRILNGGYTPEWGNVTTPLWTNFAAPSIQAKQNTGFDTRPAWFWVAPVWQENVSTQLRAKYSNRSTSGTTNTNNTDDEQQFTDEDIVKIKKLISKWIPKEDAVYLVGQIKLQYGDQPEQGPSYFWDQHSNEWTGEQALKDIPRAALDTAGFVAGGLEQAGRWVSNTLSKTLGDWLLYPALNALGTAINPNYQPMTSENQANKANVVSNIIPAIKESTLWNKSFSQAYQWANQQDVDKYKWQGLGGDLLDIWTGGIKAVTWAVAPLAVAGFSAASEAPGTQYATQALNAATQAPIDYADKKLDLGLSQNTRENLSFLAQAGIGKKLSNGSIRSGDLEPLGKVKDAIKAVPEAWDIVGEYATRTLPISRIEKDLALTPTERGNVERTGNTAGRFILEKNLAGLNKENQVSQLQRISDESYNGLTERIQPITERSNSDAARKMLQTMQSEMNRSDIVTREMWPYIKKLWQLTKQSDYSVWEKLAIRRDFDRIVGSQMFNQKWRVSWTEDKIINSWRNELSQDIQDTAQNHGIDVKSMNNDIRNSITIRDGILRDLSQKSKNNVFGLQDLGVWAILSGWEPITAAAVIVGKKALEKATPTIAQKLFNLNKSPNVPRNLTRGPVISPRDTTNGLSITPNTANSRISTGIKPKKTDVRPIKKKK